MPTYSYFCFDCEKDFEIFSYISSYKENPNCIFCKNKNTNRLYDKDILTQICSVRKGDTELKTLGDLAQRNRDRMSNDQKKQLKYKHNEYKYKKPDVDLPSGMSRIDRKNNEN
jgi:putative FmdB family regulatory protein